MKTEEQNPAVLMQFYEKGCLTRDTAWRRYLAVLGDLGLIPLDVGVEVKVKITREEDGRWEVTAEVRRC